MNKRRDDVLVGNRWSTGLASDGATVQIVYTARNLTDLSGNLVFRHAVPRGTKVVSLSGAGVARTTSRRGIEWRTAMGPNQDLMLTVGLALNVYVDDNGLPIPRLEAPKRVLDTIQIGEFRFDSDDLVWSFNDAGQNRTAILLVN